MAQQQHTIPVSCGTVRGVVEAPPSKSITHRLLIMGALAEEPLRVERPLWSEDTTVTADALELLGYTLERSLDMVVVHGRATVPEHCFVGLRNSGTSARFLPALAATEEGTTTVFDGSERMRLRPMREVVEALRCLGTAIEATNSGLPLRVQGGRLRGADLAIDVSRSSQFLSALLLIAPRIDGILRIHTTGRVVSEPYIDMTIRLLARAGVHIGRHGDTIVADGRQGCRGGTYTVEGDYSGAAFLLMAAAISGGDVTVGRLPAVSLQGDAAIVDIVEALGARVERMGDSVRVTGADLRAVDIDMNRVPDLVPVTAVACLFANGVSRLRNVAHLQFKESDRIAALLDNAARLGGTMRREGDDVVVQPRPLHGGIVDPYGDHRIAMSFALAGLRTAGITITHPGCVDKSYPEFWTTFDSLVHCHE